MGHSCSGTQNQGVKTYLSWRSTSAQKWKGMNWSVGLLYYTENICLAQELEKFSGFWQKCPVLEWLVRSKSSVSETFDNFMEWPSVINEECSHTVVHIVCPCLAFPPREAEILRNFRSQWVWKHSFIYWGVLVQFWRCRYESHALCLRGMTIW